MKLVWEKEREEIESDGERREEIFRMETDAARREPREGLKG